MGTPRNRAGILPETRSLQPIPLAEHRAQHDEDAGGKRTDLGTDVPVDYIQTKTMPETVMRMLRETAIETPYAKENEATNGNVAAVARAGMCPGQRPEKALTGDSPRSRGRNRREATPDYSRAILESRRVRLDCSHSRIALPTTFSTTSS